MRNSALAHLRPVRTPDGGGWFTETLAPVLDADGAAANVYADPIIVDGAMVRLPVRAELDVRVGDVLEIPADEDLSYTDGEGA